MMPKTDDDNWFDRAAREAASGTAAHKAQERAKQAARTKYEQERAAIAKREQLKGASQPPETVASARSIFDDVDLGRLDPAGAGVETWRKVPGGIVSGITTRSGMPIHAAPGTVPGKPGPWPTDITPEEGLEAIFKAVRTAPDIQAAASKWLIAATNGITDITRNLDD